MTPAQRFIWKSDAVGPVYELEITGDLLAIDRDGHTDTIHLADIDRVYFKCFGQEDFRRIDLEIVDSDGLGVICFVQTNATQDGNLKECRDALITFYRALAAHNTRVSLYEGLRGDRPSRFLIAVGVLLLPAPLLWLSIHYLIRNAELAVSVAVGYSIFAVYGCLVAWRQSRRRVPTTATEIVEALESL